MNALGSEVPAVRDEFLGDQRVLAEVQVHIAGQQIVTGKPFQAGFTPVLELVWGVLVRKRTVEP